MVIQALFLFMKIKVEILRSCSVEKKACVLVKMKSKEIFDFESSFNPTATNLLKSWDKLKYV